MCFASGAEARDHYGNILRTEEVIFKETRPPFQGNFAFPVSLFVLLPRWSSSPRFPYNKTIMKISRRFRGSRLSKATVGFVWLELLFTRSLLDSAFTVDGILCLFHRHKS